LGEKINLGIAIVFMAVGASIGIIFPYIISTMSDKEFLHIIKILTIVLLVLVGGIITATGIVMMLPTPEEE